MYSPGAPRAAVQIEKRLQCFLLTAAAVMDNLVLSVFYLSPAAPPHPPPSAFVAPWRNRLCLKPRQHHAVSGVIRGARGLTASRSGAGGEGEGEKHPEQKTGFRPPLPLEDDGFQVDMTALQDLVDAGEKPIR